MASRLNTKFLFLLVTIVAGVAIAVAAIAYVALKNDPTRNLERAKEAIARRDFDAAELQLSRALAKARTDLSIINEYDDLILQMRPEDSGRADELYRKHLMLLTQRVLVRSQDSQYLLALLEELDHNARLTGSLDWWAQLAEEADKWVPLSPSISSPRLAPGTEEYDIVLQYHLIADSRQSSRLPDDVVDQRETEFVEYVQAHPREARAVGALVDFLLRRALQYQLDQNPTLAARTLDRVNRILEQADAASSDDAVLAMARARALFSRRDFNVAPASEEELRAEAERIARLIAGSDDTLLYAEAVSLLPLLDPDEGRGRAIALVESSLADHPDAVIERWLLAGMYLDDGNLEGAEEEASQVWDPDSGPITTSFEATFRFDLQVRAAVMLFHIERQRLADTTRTTFDAQLARLRAARDEVAKLTAGNDQNPLVAECDAWIAMARGDFRKAASKFNQVIAQGGSVNSRVHWGYARALRETGSTGEARQFLLRVLGELPKNLPLLLETARLEMFLGLNDDARSHLEEVLTLDPANEDALSLMGRMQLAENPTAEIQDPVTQILQHSWEAFRADDVATARAILVEGIEKYPENWSMLNALSRVELAGGWEAEAIARLERYAERYPNSTAIINLLEVVRGTDPIERLRKITEVRYPNSAGEQAVVLYIDLRQLAQNERRRATSLREEARALRAAGNDQGADEQDAKAAESEQLARRSDAEADRSAAEAERVIDESHPRYADFLDRKFQDALLAKDFDTADQLAAVARRIDADQAGGLIYAARIELTRSDYESAVITLTDAAQVKPYDPWIWRMLGATYLRLGNRIDAQHAYERALELRPNDLATIRRLAPMLVQTGQMADALVLVRNAARRRQSDDQLREQWLALEEAVGDPLVTLEERRKQYTDQANDRINAVRLASMLGRMQPVRESILRDDGRPKYIGSEWSQMSNARRLEIVRAKEQEWHAEADAIFDKIFADGAGDLSVVVARAVYLRDTGREPEGTRIITEFAETQADPNAFVAIAQYFSAMKDLETAIGWLQRGLASQSPDKREIDLALATVYLEMQQFQPAIEHLERVIEVTPWSDIQRRLGLETQLVEFEIRLQRLADAENRLQRLEKQVGENAQLWLLRSSLAAARGYGLVTDGRVQEADRYFTQRMASIDRAITLAPTRPMAYVVKARALLDQFRLASTPDYALLEDALVELARATERRAGFDPAFRLRVDVLLAKQPPDYSGAITELMKILTRSPRDTSARRKIIELCLESNRVSRAIELVEEAIELEPDVALWYRWLAQLHAHTGNNSEAADAYHNAFAASGSPDDLKAWADLKLASASRGAAHEVIAELGKLSNAFAGAPVLQTSLAQALAADGRWDEAVGQLRIAYGRFIAISQQQNQPDLMDDWLRPALDIFKIRPVLELEQFIMDLSGGAPSVLERYRLGLVWLREADGASRALALFQQALDQTSETDIRTRTRLKIFIGQAYWELNDFEAGREAYEDAIELDPNNHLALNNLAFAYADIFGQPDRAIPLAERAIRLNPDNANYLDTLGVSYFKMGRLDDAVERLRQSIDLDATAGNLLHLAQVLIAQGNPNQARTHLERALRTKPNPETQAEINRLLDDISD